MNYEKIKLAFEESISRLNRLSQDATNEWALSQTRKFCPDAADLIEEGDIESAGRLLREGHFWINLLDGQDRILCFMQGDVPLAKAKFEVVFTSHDAPPK